MNLYKWLDKHDAVVPGILIAMMMVGIIFAAIGARL